VWARRNIALETCPVSYISAESLGMVEEFLVRRRLRTMPYEGLTSRQVEAFLILERELANEMSNGQHK
jgi:hypothetical protein